MVVASPVSTCVSSWAAPETVAERAFVSAPRQFAFDIPAQPLASALDAYSLVTGLEILYGSGVAAGHRSMAVQGTFTAVDALRMLLAGTPLSARTIAQDAVTIEPPRQATAAVQSVAGPPPDSSPHQFYYSLIQVGLERAFCKDDHTRPGRFRVVLKFNVTPNGEIRQPKLVGTTGDDERDRTIARVLDGVSLGRPPPADLQQPIMMVVLPQSSGNILNCASIH